MNRAERRHENIRIKIKIRTKALRSNNTPREVITDKWVGKTASTHWTCDCWMCKKPMTHRKLNFDKVNPTTLFI